MNRAGAFTVKGRSGSSFA